MYQIGFLIGRILFGGFFLMNGVNHLKNYKSLTAYTESKGIPFATLAVIVSGLMILVGGLGVILGVYIKYALALISIFLFVVTLKMHRFWKETDPQLRMAEQTQFMKNTALFGASFMMMF